jgi:hypothetical protein
MSSRGANRARRELTEAELTQLTGEFQAWLERRRNRDEQGQHATQLDAVEALMSTGADSLRKAVREIDLAQPTGDLFESCRLFDLRVLWLRRVWQFFREKFDQRDDARLQPVLKAADEVVWSCHQQLYRQAEAWAPQLKPGPAPLPYLEPFYAPEAFPAELVPPGLKSEVDVGFLREHLNKLPIPVVRLHPGSVIAPWWLVYIGHEVGHHIQYGVLPEMGLVRGFRETAAETVLRHGGSDKDATRWDNWSVEVFADVFALLVLGPWFLWAMVELELQPTQSMFARRAAYPSPAVRLRLLATAATRLGLDGEAALRGLVPSSQEGPDGEVAIDLAAARQVVDAVLEVLPGLPTTLVDLCSFRTRDHQPGGLVDAWRDHLTGSSS